MLEVENLSFSYGSGFVLKDVNFCVGEGEFVAVLGANGAGKSTLFKIICGLEKPEGGIVRIGGRPLGGYSPSELAKTRSALMQDGEFNFDSSVLDFVLLGRYAHGGFFASKEDVNIAKTALSEVGMGGFEGRIFTRLSGGERRRVELARALCQIGGCGRRDTLLMLDEPNSNLDPKNSHCAMSAAKKFAAAKTSVLAILHDVNLASQYADKIALLKCGQIFAFGKPGDVLTSENLKLAYGAENRIFEDGGNKYAVFLKQ
ncbi:MAG: ABC transporter ATP-binding protein [Opitutales bacterium]|nr:ABC transporter ATP-binding protein [Opitutales bacterium]